jgi:iron(II)-dependent oxidoreductase
MGWFFTKSERPELASYKAAAAVSFSSDPIEAAVQARRYGVFQAAPAAWRQQASFAQAARTACQQLDEILALVTEGSTSLALRINDEPGAPEREVEVAPFLLGRRVVTNEEFQLFVDSGAYEDSSLWPEVVWPHLIRFCDQSGAPGPKYWRGGRHDQRLSKHPVVGVCWYEAATYAAWAGYRLPGEAEWQITAAWQLGGNAAVPRRYPWGDALDLECCNIWASGHGKTLPVDACPGGATPNGVQQLIGNVWEWTDGEFDCVDDQNREVVGETPLRPLRGGAYDTYFPWQATSHFRTGMPPLSRVPNVGFRCAMNLPADENASGT